MLKAVIFDFDGVISNSEPCHLEAYNKILARFAIQISQQRYYNEYLGFTDYEFFQAIRQRYKTDFNGIDIKKLIEEKTEVFHKLIKQTNHLIDGVERLVTELKRNDIKIAINSGASAADIKIMLEGTGLENAFDVVVSADDVSKGKPDPQGYLLALERLNALPNFNASAKECIAIEDSHWGITSAKEAGMHVIAVTHSYPPGELKDADMIVNSLNQLKISDMYRLCAD